MRMMKVTLCSLAAALCLVLMGPAAHAQGPILPDSTHYWTWTIEPPIVITTTVQVRDQFTQTFRPVNPYLQQRLLNPVIKRHGTQVYYPRDPELHLTWWDVRPSYRSGATIRLFDQFYPNGYPTTIDTLAFMLVPATKTRQQPPPPQPPPPPGAASHYLCYRTAVPDPDQVVDLQDQFRFAQNVPVHSAEFFCAPCTKIHDGVQYPPRDEVTHLVFYEVNNPFTAFPVIIWDQFLQRQVNVYQTPKEYLVVPALKEHIITPNDKSSWGRIKALYR